MQSEECSEECRTDGSDPKANRTGSVTPTRFPLVSVPSVLVCSLLPYPLLARSFCTAYMQESLKHNVSHPVGVNLPAIPAAVKKWWSFIRQTSFRH